MRALFFSYALALGVYACNKLRWHASPALLTCCAAFLSVDHHTCHRRGAACQDVVVPTITPIQHDLPRFKERLQVSRRPFSVKCVCARARFCCDKKQGVYVARCLRGCSLVPSGMSWQHVRSRAAARLCGAQFYEYHCRCPLRSARVRCRFARSRRCDGPAPHRLRGALAGARSLHNVHARTLRCALGHALRLDTRISIVVCSRRRKHTHKHAHVHLRVSICLDRTRESWPLLFFAGGITSFGASQAAALGCVHDGRQLITSNSAHRLLDVSHPFLPADERVAPKAAFCAPSADCIMSRCGAFSV
eukprot:6064300-Pleurochrysis_carterae.AAC.3